MDDTERLLEQLTRIANQLESINNVLTSMVQEGLVVLPDSDAGIN